MCSRSVWRRWWRQHRKRRIDTSIVCYRLVCGSKHNSAAEVLKSKLYLLYVLINKACICVRFQDVPLSHSRSLHCVYFARVFVWWYYSFVGSPLISVFVHIQAICVRASVCMFVVLVCARLFILFLLHSLVRMCLCIVCLFIRILLHACTVYIATTVSHSTARVCASVYFICWLLFCLILSSSTSIACVCIRDYNWIHANKTGNNKLV